MSNSDTNNTLPFPVYRVGGCVRDALLGKTVNDIDYVVVGATPEAMLAAKYQQVGADFPVFLHPETKDEYALARTERKSGHGTTGFTVYADPSVTLEEDLSRRDFTINAMALAVDGAIIDPYGGQDDLQLGVLRHVSPAFAEDPLRVLRGARFAARYGFSIAPETRALMQQLVDEGEMEHLTRERIYEEFTKGFGTQRPSRMLAVLRDVNALVRLFPEADRARLNDDQWYTKLDQLVTTAPSLGWAYLLYQLAPTSLRETADKWRCHKEDIALADVLMSLPAAVLHPSDLSPEDVVKLWTEADARRQKQRFMHALQVLAVEHGFDAERFGGVVALWGVFDSALRGVAEGEVLKTKQPGEDPRSCIQRYRIAAVTGVLSAAPTFS